MGEVPTDEEAAAAAEAGELPEMDEEAAAGGAAAMGGQMQGQIGGMSISQDTISINDYIRLRLEN